MIQVQYISQYVSQISQMFVFNVSVSPKAVTTVETSNMYQIMLKGTKREKLHATHVKELIKTNYSEGNHIFKVSGLLVKKSEHLFYQSS